MIVHRAMRNEKPWEKVFGVEMQGASRPCLSTREGSQKREGRYADIALTQTGRVLGTVVNQARCRREKERKREFAGRRVPAQDPAVNVSPSESSLQV